MEKCEENRARCRCYSNIAEVDARSRQWETLASLISMHNAGSCTCSKYGSGGECPAARYLTGIWDISAFFHLRDGEDI